MRQWLATAVLLVGAAGAWVMGSGYRSESLIDDAAVDRAVDHRLHVVLHDLLEAERANHAVAIDAVHPVYARIDDSLLHPLVASH